MEKFQPYKGFENGAPFPFKFRGSTPVEFPGVYRAWFGEKFLLYKCANLAVSPIHLSRSIYQCIHNDTRDPMDFKKVIEVIQSDQIDCFEVEPIISIKDPLKLLMYEYGMLESIKNDPTCLNINPLPYLPKWIPAEVVANYKSWLSNK